MDDARAAKRRMRREMASLRCALPESRRRAAEQAIAAHVLAMPEYARAARVVAYAATPDEASVAAVLQSVLSSGRTLLLPRVESEGLAFVPVGDLHALRRGAFELLEPVGDAARGLGAGDLVLVPGLAFDRAGGRLGRGGGHYDRSLPRGSNAPSVFGVGFAEQVVESVPMEPHDRRVDGVVTETGVVRVAPRDRARDSG